MITRSKWRALVLGIAVFGAGFATLATSPGLARESLAQESTALDRYVASPDPNYRYDLINTIPGDESTGYVLEMTSQQWRGAAEVDRPIWKHWLVIVVPLQVKTRIGILVISGGSNNSKPPTGINPLASLLAVTTGSVVSELRMVPNQPLTFAGETRQRSEDAITAYSWDKFLRTGDDTWPLRLPMTKSAVRAMDTITAFCGSPHGGSIAVDRFVVGGASKRGWTAWTTAAVDSRVVGVVPVVIDLLNIVPSFDHHYRAYGNWAPAVREYEETGIMDWADTPQFRALMRIEDPYSYRYRLTMPKFIVNSTGDQFFLPDSSQFYFDGLMGEKYLRYVPNTDHSLKDKGADAAESALAFYESIVGGASRPEFTWHFEDDGSIRVKTSTKPTEVRLWQAANATTRDFRLQTIGPTYTSSVLKDAGDGLYVGRVAAPSQGWVAYFVEMTFPGPSGDPFKFTTGVRVMPELLPFGPPPKAESPRAFVDQDGRRPGEGVSTKIGPAH
ncbi:PhoPQ-activated pathogenicity-related protein [Rhizobiales bacterium GAS191]|nr:PhoPQ-activated pathogenicity-related protein [Rhizobiales bacterium GAS113]SEC05975.1 PhoPQ-activated pathogenicity-related protein [Rhizobiales bacterium GAS191]